ncbi:MAG: VWA domain-containing protein [Anaerolineales bacterium]
MTFTAPLFLLLLLLAPLVAWVGWPAPGPGKKREVISLTLRLIILACLALSLAGLEIVRGGNDLAVVFLVDVSDSMPPAAVSAEMDYLRQALAAMGPDDQAAVILFGADALVERPMRRGAELGRVTSAPVTNQTDLAEAIRLGLALFPPGAARRMVILSDGAQTSGDALAAARLAAASGVQIIVAPFAPEAGAEALVTQVDAPARLRPGEQFDLNVTVQASQPMRAEVRVLAGDETVYQAAHDLRRGAQTFSLPLTAGTPGFVTYQVQIAPEDTSDTFYQNNYLSAFSLVEGPPRILMVAPPAGETLPGGGTRPDETSSLLAALQAAGFTIEQVIPAYLPAHLPSLAQYNAVLLVDVPARQLGLNQMKALQTYVRDLGGGLAAIGGPSSFGVGGYYGTPLEDALPVDMQIKDEQRRPTLAMVFIIDHSGSMSETSGGVSKLELAKEAVARSLDLVFPTDRIGVIAFDDVASWVVPMTDLTEPDAALAAVGGIQIGGGTDILAGLQAMAKVLPDEPAKVKHVILLTDGGADPAGIPELVERLYTENGITLSTVGVGNDAAPFLEDLASLGGGRYHFTANPGSIPSIFTEETSLATRAYLVEETFLPRLVNPSPILQGISNLPTLRGYVATSPKSLAQVVLESEKGDPILATWQYGLGRSLAFTSDASGRWAHDWLRSEQFAIFWAQAVRSVLSETREAALEMDVSLQGKQARLRLDALDLGGEFLNNYQVQASLVAPDGEAQSLTLRQSAPGRYEADFTPTQQGVYLIRFSGSGPEGGHFAETTGWTLSYSPEYRRLEPDPDLLLRLAALSGGTKFISLNPANVFSHDRAASRASRPAWPWLLALAALLLPFDVASRRLILTRQDFLRLREALRIAFATRRRPAPVPLPTDARLDALCQAKERVRAETPPRPASFTNTKEPEMVQPPHPLQTTFSKPPFAESPEPASLPVPPLGTAETLLKRKQARQSQSERGRIHPPKKE